MGGDVVSWDIDLETLDGYTIPIVMGHTFNLTPMWRLAGVVDDSLRELDGMSAGAAHVRAAKGVLRAVMRPADFKALNPANGWGSFDGWLRVLTDTAVICSENPEGIVRVS